MSVIIDSYKNEGKSLSRIDCNNYCSRVLKEDYPFLREVDKFALTNSIYNMDSSYQKFFKEGAGYPKFKNKHQKRQNYTTNYNVLTRVVKIKYRKKFYDTKLVPSRRIETEKRK